MKSALYSLIIAIVFAGILFYLVGSLSPWNNSAVDLAVERFGLLTNEDFKDFIAQSVREGTIINLLDVKNLIILSVVALVTITSAFSTIHFFLDKLFFKKFYEKPSVFNAVRRGILFSLLAETLVILRLLGSFELYIVVGCVILAILIELLFVMIVGKKGEEKAKRRESEAEKGNLEKEVGMAENSTK